MGGSPTWPKDMCSSTFLLFPIMESFQVGHGLAGARVEPAPYKRDPGDFVLWKPSEEGDIGWESPWGTGRPGWHIECSAMSIEYLGADFDIHGGGEDLIFPHHENEIVQSCCAYPDTKFARVWLHNGYLQSEGTKMSKSLNNFYTVKELLGVGDRQRMWRGESLRLMMLSTQYRQSLDFRVQGIDKSKNKLDRWYRASALGSSSDVAPSMEFLEALRDDLNTPLAISVLDAMCGRILGGDQGRVREIEEFIAGAQMLGLLRHEPSVWFQGGSLETETRERTQIESLIEQRASAKKEKDFETADHIRKVLTEKGVTVEDKPGGQTTWRWST